MSTSKCYQYFPGPTNWLLALQLCIAQGGTLAKIESQAEHDLVQGLVGTSDPAWIGLQVSGEGRRGGAGLGEAGDFNTLFPGLPDGGNPQLG